MNVRRAALAAVLALAALAPAPAGAAPTLTEFLLPAYSEPKDIALGSDGNLWVTLRMNVTIARITPTGEVTEFPLPSTLPSPQRITPAPDGSLWFTAGGTIGLGRITTDGIVTPIALPRPAGDPDNQILAPRDVIAAPDGTMRITADSGTYTRPVIATLTTSGAVVDRAQVGDGDNRPQRMAFDAAGRLWFTMFNYSLSPGTVHYVGVLDPANPTPTLVPVPTGGADPFGIARGPDGRIWFTERNADKVGVIDPNHISAGITELALPPSLYGAEPMGIAAGGDGGVWLAGNDSGSLFRFDATGANLLEPPMPYASNDPTEVTAGPGSTVWYIHEAFARVGRVDTVDPDPGPGPGPDPEPGGDGDGDGASGAPPDSGAGGTPPAIPPPAGPPPATPPAPRPAAPALSAPRIAGRALSVKVAAAATVRARFERCTRVRKGKRTVTSCRTVATATRRVTRAGTAKLTIPRKVRAGRYRVTITATATGVGAARTLVRELTVRDKSR